MSNTQGALLAMLHGTKYSRAQVHWRHQAAAGLRQPLTPRKEPQGSLTGYVCLSAGQPGLQPAHIASAGQDKKRRIALASH